MQLIRCLVFILLFSHLGLAYEPQKAASLFKAKTFSVVYMDSSRKLMFKDPQGRNLGEYKSRMNLPMMENDASKKYMSVVETQWGEALLTQWENGRYMNVRIFLPLSDPSKTLELQPLCEIVLPGDGIDFKDHPGNFTKIENSKGKLAFEFKVPSIDKVLTCQ